MSELERKLLRALEAVLPYAETRVEDLRESVAGQPKNPRDTLGRDNTAKAIRGLRLAERARQAAWAAGAAS